MGTYYIWLTAVDEGYEFHDEVSGTDDDLNDALAYWNKRKDVTVIGITE